MSTSNWAIDLVIIGIIGVITWFIWDYLDGRHQPPGPQRLPFIGNMIQAAIADPIPYIGLYKICKRYGKHGVTRIQLGFMNTVFINSLGAMKDLYTREECLSRVFGEEGKARNMNKNLGIIIGEGQSWMEMRRFTLKTLRNLGMSNRNLMEATISSEVNLTLEEMKGNSKASEDGTIRMSQEFFALTTLNVLLWMVTGERCDRQDKSSMVNRFLRAGKRFVDAFSVVSGLYNFWPFLITWAPSLSGFTLMKELSQNMRDIAREIFQQAKAPGRYKTSQNNFVDEFLARMDEEEEQGIPEHEKIFTEDQFVITTMDLIQAGSDTTSGNMAFGILLLATFPKVQDKFLDEIIGVAGPGEGVPCLDDRDKMPYTQALILETIRYARVLIFLPRKVLKEFWYQGYLFKKDTILMLSAHNMSMDPAVWEDPHNFRPERFLKSEDGPFNKVFTEERILPFGIGKRSCAGEGLARDSLFLMLTTLVKKLSFSLPEGRPKPSLIPVMGMSGTPAPFHVLIKPRITS